LGPCELFDGGVYDAESKVFTGAWLDLRALSGALRVPSAVSAIQALYLAAALDEVSGTTAVFLSTANMTRDGRPGQRTHRRVTFSSMRSLPRLLAHLKAEQGVEVAWSGEDERRHNEFLLVRVRERGASGVRPGLRAHLARFETALRAADHVGPRILNPEMWSMAQELANGQTAGVAEALDQIERTQGSTSEVAYMRARAAFVRGEQPTVQVAETFSTIAENDRQFHEAELGAARAWLAAGNEKRARVHARRIADNEGAPDSMRMTALEILDETSRSVRPSDASEFIRGGDPGSLDDAPAQRRSQGIGVSGKSQESHGADPELRADSETRDAPPGASLPPMASASEPPEPNEPDDRKRARMSHVYEPELVEGLALPLGAPDEASSSGQFPTTPVQARAIMTRLARSVGRDYRLWYGVTLRCDVLSVDIMQRHLLQRYSNTTLTDPRVVAELQRHGALLSEIIARAMGADWVDIATTEPGYWAMSVPPRTRCWPIGRVFRFLSLGHRERDLVSFYLDLEARARGALS